ADGWGWTPARWLCLRGAARWPRAERRSAGGLGTRQHGEPQRPRHVIWFDSFPLNALNKVLKRELAQTAIALLATAQAAAGRGTTDPSLREAGVTSCGQQTKVSAAQKSSARLCWWQLSA